MAGILPLAPGIKVFWFFSSEKNTLPEETPSAPGVFLSQQQDVITMTKTANAAELQKISELIKDIKVAMLTSDDGGHLRSRPMVAAQEEFSGELFFFTRATAPKVGEVEAHDRVNVSYADADRQNYVSLSGTASIVHDPAMIKAHWSEGMRTWFPRGKDDPDIAILKVAVDQAEYWDAPSSTMLYLYGYAKAVVTGESPHPGGNAKVAVG